MLQKFPPFSEFFLELAPFILPVVKNVKMFVCVVALLTGRIERVGLPPVSSRVLKTSLTPSSAGAKSSLPQGGIPPADASK